MRPSCRSVPDGSRPIRGSLAPIVLTASRFALLSLAVYGVSLGVMGIASWITGPAFVELGRIAAVGAAERLVLEVVEHGPGALASPAAAAVYDTARDHGAWATVMGAWLSLAAQHVPGIDVLTAQRAPWLGMAACVPLATFWMAERAFGVSLGLLAALWVLVQPWLLHGSAVGEVGVIVAGLQLLVFACYVRGLPSTEQDAPCRRASWNVAAAVVLGMGLAMHHGVLWIVPAVLLHFALLRRRSVRRLMALGRLPVPSAVLFALVLTPLAFAGCAPQAWRGGAPRLVEWLLAPVGAAGEGSLYQGAIVVAPPFPLTEPVHALLARIPFGVVLLACLGVGFWVRRVLEGQRSPDRSGLGLAVGLFFVATILSPVLMPPVLAAFPTRVAVAAVCVTLAAAVGLDGLGRRFLPPSWSGWGTWGAGGVLGAYLLLDLHTAGGAFTSVVGGPSGVLERQTFRPSNGSEVAAAVPIAQALGLSSVTSAEVPAGYWKALVTLGRAPEGFGGSGPSVRLVRGAHAEAMAAITYRGTALWSLVP
jgi:hypothetical protein